MLSIFYLIVISSMISGFDNNAKAFPVSKVFESQGLEGSNSLIDDKLPKQNLVRKRISHATNEQASPESKYVENNRILEQFDIESFWYVNVFYMGIIHCSSCLLMIF